jgi:dihydroorotase/N-acyl-D-amino-acid deacylase
VRSILAALFALALGQPSSPAEFDILISGGRLVDGSGTASTYGNLAIRGDRIAAIGALSGASASLRIDARGRSVAPGFIDIHCHARWGIFEHPDAENYIRQGVTTVIDGNDGDSPIPIGRFLDRLSQIPMALNFGIFAGQGSIREAVLDDENRPATPDEILRMQDLVRRAMLEEIGRAHV